MSSRKQRQQAITTHNLLLKTTRKKLLRKEEIFLCASHPVHGTRILSYKYNTKSSLARSVWGNNQQNSPTKNPYYFNLVVTTKLYKVDNTLQFNYVHNGYHGGHWGFGLAAKYITGSCALITDLHTPREFRGKGITKVIFLAVMADMAEAGFSRMQAVSPSQEGRRFYQSCGWKRKHGQADLSLVFDRNQSCGWKMGREYERTNISRICSHTYTITQHSTSQSALISLFMTQRENMKTKNDKLEEEAIC